MYIYQSIYAWRGARPSNMNTLSRDYPSLLTYELRQNYRCSSSITRVANAILGREVTVAIDDFAEYLEYRGMGADGSDSDEDEDDGDGDEDGGNKRKKKKEKVKKEVKVEPVRVIRAANDEEQAQCIASLVKTLTKAPPKKEGKKQKPPPAAEVCDRYIHTHMIL